MASIFSTLIHANCDDINVFAKISQKILQDLVSDKALLRSMLESVAESEELLSMCEHYDILDKIVLYKDTTQDFRLRLHIFLPGYFDRPHNHRWSYSSYILHGSYHHTLYGQDDNLSEKINVQALNPMLVREERCGSTYTIHHSMIHSVIAQPYTVSLIIRGPSQKARFLVMDKETNEAWWQYGAKDETRQERDMKAMSLERLRASIAKMYELGLV